MSFLAGAITHNYIFRIASDNPSNVRRLMVFRAWRLYGIILKASVLENYFLVLMHAAGPA